MKMENKPPSHVHREGGWAIYLEEIAASLIQKGQQALLPNLLSSVPWKHVIFSVLATSVHFSHSCNRKIFEQVLPHWTPRKEMYINHCEHWNKNEKYICFHIEKYIQIQVPLKTEKFRMDILNKRKVFKTVNGASKTLIFLSNYITFNTKKSWAWFTDIPWFLPFFKDCLSEHIWTTIT